MIFGLKAAFWAVLSYKIIEIAGMAKDLI